MAKLTGLLMSLLMLGVAHAQEAAEQPLVLPEPNYLGIMIFLGLMVGGGIWFMWKVMRNKGDEKK